MRLQHVVEDGLDFVGGWAEGMGQESLISSAAVAVNGRFDG
jgi:hypothetical protein